MAAFLLKEGADKILAAAMERSGNLGLATIMSAIKLAEKQQGVQLSSKEASGAKTARKEELQDPPVFDFVPKTEEIFKWLREYKLENFRDLESIVEGYGEYVINIFHWAAARGGKGTMEDFIDSPEYKQHVTSNTTDVIINAKDLAGNTPLHYAVLEGSPDVVEYLLSLSADSRIQNIHDKTPLNLLQASKLEKVSHDKISNLISNQVTRNTQSSNTPATSPSAAQASSLGRGAGAQLV